MADTLSARFNSVTETPVAGDSFPVQYSIEDSYGSGTVIISRMYREPGGSTYKEQILINGGDYNAGASGYISAGFFDRIPDSYVGYSIYYRMVVTSGSGQTTQASTRTWTVLADVDPPEITNFSYTAPAVGTKCTVSFTIKDTDGKSGTFTLYRLVRAQNATTWTRVKVAEGRQYTKSGQSFSLDDTIPANCIGYSIRYLLSVTSSTGLTAESYTGTKTIGGNSKPTTPGNLDVPSSIRGGATITISWGASTDADDNLAGYILERSIDRGTTWTLVYQGTALTTTNNIDEGTESVMYRVKAYDTYDAASDWFTTPTAIAVTNNTDPIEPSSISVPTPVKAGSNEKVSWPAGSDPDGDAISYTLQRSIDNKVTWTTIYSGTALLYNDPVSSEWENVCYRVRTVDSHGATSSWKTSAVRTIANNVAPTIAVTYNGNAIESGSTLSGNKSSSFSLKYTINDENAGDTLTCKEYLDNVEMRSITPVRGQENTFSFNDGSASYWQKIVSGKHTIKFEVSDGTETTTFTVSFTKKVTTASATMKGARIQTAASKIDACAISFDGSLPSTATVNIQVTNNAKDVSPVWEDVQIGNGNTGTNLQPGVVYYHTFANNTQTSGWAINFKITANRGSASAIGYITSVQGTFTTES